MSVRLSHSWFSAMLVIGVVSAQGEDVKRVLVPTMTQAEAKVQARAEVQEAAFLGVQTDHVPESLAWHLKLASGFGLMVEEVMPGSPAAKAGLRRFDVLLRYQDQQLVNMDQLQVLVRSGKKGDTVKLLVLSQGQEKQMVATLDEGPVEIGHPRRSAEEQHDKSLSSLGTGQDWERRQTEWKSRVNLLQEQTKTIQQE